ncbi:MAG: hypothetical protein SCM96_10785 [Acidobacteriota bacterium]|nr:hypothetical protein [Acidobacteriota bacterium]
MSDYIPSRRFKRLEAFTQRVAEDLNVLKDNVQKERIETDEYAFIFERGLRGASDFPQPEKLDAFRGILVNSLLPNDLTQDQREFFLTLVERLSPVHLRILRFMGDTHNYLSAMSIPISKIQGGFSTFFPVALPGVGLPVIRAAFSDLYTLGLLNTSPDVFSTMTSAQGLQLLGNRLTPLAETFVRFCKSPT